MNQNNNNILTSIDTLLDTRYGLLSLVKPDILPTVLKTYHKRKSDNFQPIGHKLFKYLYRRRTTPLLAISKPTRIISFIQDYISGIISDTNNERPVVFVNVYPYHFSEEEALSLKTSLLPFFTNAKNIVIINKRRLRPTWLNSTVNMIVDYSGLDLLSDLISFHNGEVELLDTTLITPPLIYSMDKVVMADLDKLKKDVRPVIQLEFLPIEAFSINLITSKKKTEKTKPS